MKKAEEIKKGLECCSSATVESCGECPYHTKEDYSAVCIVHLTKDAKVLLAQVDRERDAAVADLETVIELSSIVNLDCEYCKYMDRPMCEECEWEWRGVCPENSKEENR